MFKHTLTPTMFAGRCRGTRPAGVRLAPVLTLLLPVFAFAQSGPVPEYIESMSAFEVRALDGAYAPSNGNVSIESVTPAEWRNNDPSNIGLRGIVVAWSGGGKNLGSRMFVHGGGHADSANNGMYIYDYSGTSAPTGWQLPAISSVSDVRSNVATYADGGPNSVHTYDGVVYASHNNHVYRFGGSRYISGSFVDWAFKYNVNSGEWSRLPDYPGGDSGAKTIYDPATGKIFVTVTNSTTGYFFRTDNETWSPSKSLNGNSFPWDSMAAWDSSRNRAIVVGDGETSIVNVDFANETVSVQSFSPSGDTDIYSRNGISAVYDPIRDVFWLFGGNGGSPGYSSIYQLRADGGPWTTTRINLTGASISLGKDLQGSWGRYVFMPQWAAIGLVANTNSPAYVIRVAEEVVPAPEPPSALNAQ